MLKGMDALRVRKLAESMTPSITCKLNDNSLLRRLSVHELIPEGQLAYLDSDDKDKALLVFDESGENVQKHYTRAMVPPFEIVVKAYKPFRVVREKQYKVCDELKTEIQNGMLQKENEFLYRFLEGCVNTEGKEKSVKYIQMIVKKILDSKEKKLMYDIILTDKALELMDKSFLVYLINEPIIKISGQPYCWILWKKALWNPYYCEDELLPGTKELEQLFGFICYSLMGLAVNTESCRFYKIKE